MKNVLAPLTGYTVAVTAQRRADELAALLERRGARTVVAPTLRIVPLPDDEALRAATVELIREAPDVIVATTGIGFRGWLEAAEGWGMGDDLLRVMAGARILCRGPKALGAVRAAGLTEEWTAPSETGTEVVEYLKGRGVGGQRVAIQLHGDPAEDFIHTVRDGGGAAVPVPVYRWTLPTDITPVQRLVDAICARRIDAVTFTSAPAANALLRIAGDQAADMLEALRAPAEDNGVLPVAVGPVTAAPLVRLGVDVVQPQRARLGALVRTVASALPKRSRRLMLATGHRIELRGHMVLLDDEPYQLPPAPMAVIRALASADGKVLSRAELLGHLPRGADGHAVEMAVTRLRDAVNLRSCVETVIKRGYRLNLET
nr:uroporphyrinogen-III synthase [Glycomyces tenuis]